MKKQNAIIKMYNWQDLTHLVVNDMAKQLSVECKPDTSFHYIGGLDAERNPFIRVDLTPCEEAEKNES